MRVLKYFQVHKPTHTPARIIQAVFKERKESAKVSGMVKTLNSIRCDLQDYETTNVPSVPHSYQAREQKELLVELYKDMKSFQKFYDERVVMYRKAEAEGKLKRFNSRRPYW